MPGEWTLVHSGREWKGVEGVCSHPLHSPSAYRPGLMCVSVCICVHIMCISLYGACVHVCCSCSASVYGFTYEWMQYLFRYVWVLL